MASSSLSAKKMGSLLGTVCDMTDCFGLEANAITSKYGAYSTCEVKYQLASALSKYYTEQNGHATL